MLLEITLYKWYRHLKQKKSVTDSDTDLASADGADKDALKSEDNTPEKR